MGREAQRLMLMEYTGVKRGVYSGSSSVPSWQKSVPDAEKLSTSY